MTDSAPTFDQILHGDALTVLPTLPEDCVDLVFADPPYFLQLAEDLWRPNLTLVDAVNEDWDHFEGYESYDTFTRDWLRAVQRVMKDTATIWISGTYHNIFRVGAILQDLGFWMLNMITWSKPNAMPNFRGTRFKNDIEIVIWAKPAQTGSYTFNHHDMKRFNDGKQLGSVWEIPVCGGAERLKDEKGKKRHPTQKPEELLRRILLASSVPGDVVLDPFVGTGTTAAVAKSLHRRWIGIDSDAAYVQLARARVAAVQPLAPSDPMLRASSQHKPARVPFKTLIKQGYLRPGQTLFLSDSDHVATILHNGKLQVGNRTGSIHQLGARLKHTPSCNGWKHWYYRDETTGEYHLIDELRQNVREAMKKDNKR